MPHVAKNEQINIVLSRERLPKQFGAREPIRSLYLKDFLS